MPTATHEVLHRIFQEDPDLFPRAIAKVLDIKFPETTGVAVLNIDLTEIEPVGASY